MIVIAGAVLGGSWGAWLARKRGGKPADMAQYAAGYAIAFALLGLFVTVLIDRIV
ncbi:MAG: hypothetical protein AAGF94_07595 [Pseudomonadota bacterium]